MIARSRLLPGTLVVWALVATADAAPGDDPDERRNRVAQSDLPRGPGLAAKFTGDRGIEAHGSVIFADNFETGDWRTRWDSARGADDGTLSIVDASSGFAGVGRRSLTATAVLGKNTGGGLTEWFEPADNVHIRFYVKFDKRCDYVHHFVTLRANKSLQGGDKWSGFGGAGIKPVGDERFSTALEPWGNWGRWPPPGRWNFYSYWHGMSVSRDGKYWGNGFRPTEQPNIARDKWICAEFMLEHNTPGRDDGEQAFWIDGQLRGHWTGINWRKAANLRANALTLESYVTDRWTKNKVNIVTFDNVVIARDYIGPVGLPRRGEP